MIKKCIRGNEERGKEVTAELEKLGGINKYELVGDDEDKELFLIGNCFRTKEEALEKSKEIMNILRKEDEDIEFDNDIKTTNYERRL